MAVYLVIGGAGFIGSHIVEALIRRGDSVRVFDNFTTGKRANLAHLPGVEVIEGDIRDTAVVCQAMAKVDYVIHQAALVSVTQSIHDPSSTHHVNVTGTLNVLAAAREYQVKRVVLASSCAVYGDNLDLPLTEKSETRPLSPYAASKLIGEVYCQTVYRAYGVPTVCLRYFNVYGPRQDPESEYAAVIPRFLQRIRQGLPPIIYGDGLQTRDFVHVSDVAHANLLACEREEASGQVLNVASGRSVSLLELFSALNGLCNTHFTPRFEPARAGDIQHSRGDGSRLAAVLGFQPAISLMAGLQQMLS
jgi:UDP-N-acetylglucosamine/UDP-N-acetyl-alpha-D-glucosaminouronate 4-epimerase